MEQIYKSQYSGPQIDEAILKAQTSVSRESITQTTGTSTSLIMSQNAVSAKITMLTNNINTLETQKMPKSGGTFTGAVKFNENDGNCINYDNGFYVNKTGGSTLIGTNGTKAWVGTPDTELTMRGNAAKPTYNGKDLALSEEIVSDVLNGITQLYQYSDPTGSFETQGLDGKSYTLTAPAAVRFYSYAPVSNDYGYVNVTKDSTTWTIFKLGGSAYQENETSGMYFFPAGITFTGHKAGMFIYPIKTHIEYSKDGISISRDITN